MQPSGAPQQFNEFASWRGEWASGSTYDKGEAVFHDGSSYICLQFDVIGTEPGTDEDVWYLLAQGAAGGEEGLAGHLADTADAHDASAVSYAGGAGLAATDVEAAIDELSTEKSDTTHDHDADYEASGAVATHAAAGDPHTGYRLESADHTHASTGLQAGTIDHGVLTGMSDDDHPQYGKLAAANTWADENFAQTNWYFHGPKPYIDVADKYGLVLGNGASSTDQENNADFLNQAFSDNHGTSFGRRLRLPEENILIRGQVVGLSVAVDTNGNLEIFGPGIRGTQIYQQTSGLGVMKFETTSGNLRQLKMYNVALRGTATTPGYDLELLKVGYSWFRDITFWTGGGVHIGTSSFQNVLADCWWLNTDSGSRALLIDTSSEATLLNPLIGEDGGSIWVAGAQLRIKGGQMKQWPDGVDADGPNAMGNSHLVVTGDGTLLVDGAMMSIGDQAAVLCSLDNGIVEIRNCRITVHDNSAAGYENVYLIRQRTMTSPQHFVFASNFIEAHDASTVQTLQVFDQFGGTEPHDSIIAGNEFLLGTNWAATLEDTFFDPDNNNVYLGNVLKHTTGVS